MSFFICYLHCFASSLIQALLVRSYCSLLYAHEMHEILHPQLKAPQGLPSHIGIAKNFHHHLCRQPPERSSHILSDCSLTLYPPKYYFNWLPAHMRESLSASSFAIIFIALLLRRFELCYIVLLVAVSSTRSSLANCSGFYPCHLSSHILAFHPLESASRHDERITFLS